MIALILFNNSERQSSSIPRHVITNSVKKNWTKANHTERHKFTQDSYSRQRFGISDSRAAQYVVMKRDKGLKKTGQSWCKYDKTSALMQQYLIPQSKTNATGFSISFNDPDLSSKSIFRVVSVCHHPTHFYLFIYSFFSIFMWLHIILK